MSVSYHIMSPEDTCGENSCIPPTPLWVEKKYPTVSYLPRHGQADTGLKRRRSTAITRSTTYSIKGGVNAAVQGMARPETESMTTC